MKHLSETFLHREVLTRGKLLHVYRDSVLLADGSVSIREWIDHPGAAAIVPFFEDGTTLLIHQFRYPTQRVFIELPAGKRDHPDEAFLDTAKRELAEETGFEANLWHELGSCFPGIGYSNEEIYFFLARDLFPTTIQAVAGEFVAPFRLPFPKAVQMAKSGELKDAKTAFGLILAANFLRENGIKL